MLGLRTDHEILASRARVVERAQFTELDCRLLARADAQGHVSYAGPFLRDRRRLAERSQELRRLEMLVSLGLARRIGAGRWALSRELEPTLRQCQLAGDIMKSRARHQAHLSDPRLPLVVTRIEAGTLLAGRVIGTGLADELRDRRYLLLEGTDRRLHYILQTRTWSERAGRRASAWATTSRSPATRSRGKGERAWADLPRPSARLR